MQFRFAAVLGLLLSVAGCTGDAVTTPSDLPDLAGAVVSQQTTAGLCCDPVIVVVPHCDPYLQLDFSCEDGGGNCMSSTGGATTAMSCGGGGGGSGGTGPLPDGGTTKPKPPTAPCPDYGCTPPPSACDPMIDPDCYKPLTGADSAAIMNAIARFVRPKSAIPDPVAAQECENMLNGFNTLYSNGWIMRGAYTTTEDTGLGLHTGAWDRARGLMHIDPKYLDQAAQGGTAALRELADTLLHEAAHALMFDHPNGSIDTQWGPLYTDPYFNRLAPGANSCLVW